MPFLTSRGPGVPAESIMTSAWYSEPLTREARLHGAVVEEASVEQEGFFAPRSWAEEIDRPGSSLGKISVRCMKGGHPRHTKRGYTWACIKGKWVQVPRAIVKPSPPRVRPWGEAYRRIEAIPAKGVPRAAREVAAAAIARAIAERDQRIIRKRMVRGIRRHRRRVRARRMTALQYRRALAKARQERARRRGWWRRLEPKTRRRFKRVGLRPMRRRGRFVFRRRTGRSAISLPPTPLTRRIPFPFPGSPSLRGAGLGQISVSKEDAAREAGNVATGVVAQLEYLEGITPANWDARLRDSQKLTVSYLDRYKNMIRGRTGNPALETKVREMIFELSKATEELTKKSPSFWARAYAEIKQFMKDFLASTMRVIGKAVMWFMTKATPLLSRYHKAVVSTIEAEKELNEQTKAGEVPADQLLKRGKEIGDNKSKIASIQSLFSSVSGGEDIDKYAQEEYGTYPTLGLKNVTIPIAVAIAVILLGAAILGLVILLIGAPIAKGIAQAIPLIAIVIGAVVATRAIATAAATR